MPLFKNENQIFLNLTDILKVISYAYPLAEPIAVYNRLFHDRKGIWIQTSNGWLEYPYFSEISPFTIEQWMERSTTLIQSSLDRFGGSTIEVAALIRVGDTVDTIQQKVKQGFRVFKLKMGGQDWAIELERLRQVTKLLPPNGQLRLDINRQWSLAHAIAVIKDLEQFPIEFVEEPTQNPEDSLIWAKQTHLPLAWDETIWQTPKMLVPNEVQVVVLKPALIMPNVPWPVWIKEWQQKGHEVVLSACFETGVGVANIVAWSTLTKRAAGIDTQWQPKLGQGFFPQINCSPHLNVREVITDIQTQMEPMLCQ